VRLGEVLAGGERALAGAGHDDGADRGVGVEGAQRGDDLVAHRPVPGVQLGRLVEGDDADPALAVEQHGVVLHGGSRE
jgi:hypothetical protein